MALNCNTQINLNNPFRLLIELRWGNTVDGIRLEFFTDDIGTPMDFTGWTFETDFFDIEVELPNVLILSKSAEGMEVPIKWYDLDIKGTLNGIEKTVVAGKYEVKKDYLTSGCVQDGSTINLQYFNVIERIYNPDSVMSLSGEFVNNDDPKNPIIEGIEGELNTRVLASYLDELIIKSDDGFYTIEDNKGVAAFRIFPDGGVDIPKFSEPLKVKIKDLFPNISDKISNLKISIIGDSISTANGGGTAGLVGDEQYYGLLKTRNNCEIFVNAVAGSSIAIGGQSSTVDFCVDTRWQSLNSVFTPDVVFIFGGINDFLQDFPLSTLGSTDNTMFYGALDYLYKNIMNRVPNARVFHITPLHTLFAQGGGLIPEFNGQNHLTDYINAIHEVSNRYGVSIIDTNKNSGITCYNISTYATDLIHVNKYGHEIIYNTIINETNLKL